jgi:hypothetical protein
MLGSEGATAIAPTDWVGWLVEDGVPGAAIVVGLPHAAVDLAHVEDVGLGGDAGDGAGAASAEGSDHAPVEFAEQVGGDLLGGGGAGDGE